MKKYLSMIVVLLTLFAMPAFAELMPNQEGLYEIGTLAKLEEFRNGINDGSIPANSNAKLTADIDLKGESWQPIGHHVPVNPGSPNSEIKDDYSYRGTFDGGGFTIQNLTVTEKDLVYAHLAGIRVLTAGFFGVLSKDAHVSDLSFEGVWIDMSEYKGGSYLLAGTVAGAVLSGDVWNCTMTDGLLKGFYVAGGIVGVNWSGNVGGCVVERGTVIAELDVGGVAGWNYAGEIQNCIVNSTVVHGPIDSRAGGVIGDNLYGDILNCTMSGCSISGDVAGGVAGYNGNNIQNSTVRGGVIKGNYATGGVVGNIWGGLRPDIQNCAVFGVRISGVHEKYATSGAIAGRIDNGTIRNCIAMEMAPNSVSASTENAKEAYAGGALGYAHIDRFGTVASKISNMYYPAGIVNSVDIYSAKDEKPHEWAIGNIRPDEMGKYDYTEVTAYNANLSPDELPCITAVIEQGVAVTINKDEGRTLDLTLLPGTIGNVTYEWSIQGDGAGILRIEEPEEGLKFTVTGLELGTTIIQCVVTGLMGVDEDSDPIDVASSPDAGENDNENKPLILTCSVTVVDPVTAPIPVLDPAPILPPDPGPKEPGTDPADPAPTPTGGGSSSNCNSGFRISTLALLGLFMLKKRK